MSTTTLADSNKSIGSRRASEQPATIDEIATTRRSSCPRSTGACTRDIEVACPSTAPHRPRNRYHPSYVCLIRNISSYLSVPAQADSSASHTSFYADFPLAGYIIRTVPRCLSVRPSVLCLHLTNPKRKSSKSPTLI